MRPQQHKGVNKILHDMDGDGKLLLVERTGGGKSLTMQMVLTMTGGIALIIVPLLALTADQVEKIRRANSSFGSVEAHHIDDLTESFIRESLIPRMMEISPRSSSCMYLFCSPQDLVKKACLRIAVLECCRRKTLRLVVIDEAHLYAMHGSTFREPIRLLHKLFFSIVFGVGQWHPLFLAMSATMTAPLVASLSTLTNVDWTDKRFHLWSNTTQFRQRNISIGFGITSDIGTQAIPRLVEFLSGNPTMYACLFVNFVRECSKWSGVLEGQLGTAKVKAFVLQITGEMDKHEKFAFIRLFTSSAKMDGMYPRVLAATSAANTGIDQALLGMVLRIGLARCVVTLLQEMGRNARQPGMKGIFLVFSDWKMFVTLLLSILLPRSEGGSEPAEYTGLNSVILSKSPLAKRRSFSMPRGMSAPLSSKQISDNIIDAHNNLLDVLRLYCLPGFGCIHCRREYFMATGELSPPPEIILGCVTQCFVCDKSYKRYFLPVIHAGATKFLKSRKFNDAIATLILQVGDCDRILDLLFKDKDCLFDVFGKVSVLKYQVTGFFFQLVATKILAFEWVGNKVKFIVNRDNDGNYTYENKLAWEGIILKNKGTGIDASFGFLVHGPDWQYNPSWYQNNWRSD